MGACSGRPRGGAFGDLPFAFSPGLCYDANGFPRCPSGAERPRAPAETGRRNGMVREIMRDEAFLSRKAEPATEDDLETGRDLLDTLAAHKEGCVGMAANMIGIAKRVIVFDNGGTYQVMYNPEILKRSGPYEAEEGCLSLDGVRKARRWQSIKVRYQNERFQVRLKTFIGWTAQIIQHEIDHCEGILI